MCHGDVVSSIEINTIGKQTNPAVKPNALGMPIVLAIAIPGIDPNAAALNNKSSKRSRSKKSPPSNSTLSYPTAVDSTIEKNFDGIAPEAPYEGFVILR